MASSAACVGFLYSNPLRLPGNEREGLQAIRENLHESGRQVRFVADVATTCSLRKLLNSGCQVLHYAGHGNDTCLAFESSESSKCGVVEPLEVERLKSMFEAGGVKEKTKLVIVNSCSSEPIGKAFVKAGVPHVVAVKQSQSVSAARKFSELFYDALMTDSGTFTIRQAFEIALQTINASDSYAPHEDGSQFLLLPEDGNHDVLLFDSLPEGDLVDDTKLPPTPPRCQRPVSSYKGRAGLQRGVEFVLHPQVPCVTITGEHGSGKTEMAIQVCEYVRERRHFDSFLWADMKKAVAKAEGAALSSLLGLASPLLPGALGLPSSVDSVLDPCRLIGLAVGMPEPGPSSREDLLGFLVKNPREEEGPPCKKVLLVLDNADALFNKDGDARGRLVKLLSYLSSTMENLKLKLLVTSEHELLRHTKERFNGDRSEVVVEVKPLSDANAANFLNEKLPRPFSKTWLGIELGAPCTPEDITNAIREHPVLKEVLKEAQGHPGTLLRVGPMLLDHLDDPDLLKEMVARYREEFRPTHPSPDSPAVSPTPSETKPPPMDPDDQRAWEAARRAGVSDRGCLLVWVEATRGALLAHSKRQAGGESMRGRSGPARHDSVPWACLEDPLKDHLNGKLTVPSSQGSIGRAGEEECEEKEKEKDEEDNPNYDNIYYYTSIYTVPEHVLHEPQLRFIRGVLKRKQDALSSRGGGGRDDVVSLGAFALFSRWWAPVVSTFVLLRNEWTEIGVHGFISREEAARALEESGQPGMYLLRFSENHHGALAVSFVRALANLPLRTKVYHNLVDVDEEGCFFRQKPQRRYNSLRALLRSSSLFKTIYPEWPSEVRGAAG